MHQVLGVVPGGGAAPYNDDQSPNPNPSPIRKNNKIRENNDGCDNGGNSNNRKESAHHVLGVVPEREPDGRA